MHEICMVFALKADFWSDIVIMRQEMSSREATHLMLKNNEARVHRSFKIGCMRAFCFMFVLEGLVRNGRTLLRLKNEHI